MFNPIYTFLKNNSYGPSAAVVSDCGSYRFVKLEPHEEFVVYINSTIYLLVTGSNCRLGESQALKITSTGAKLVCIGFSREYINKQIMENEKREKFVLDRSPSSKKIEELLNLCIEVGIFTI